MPTTVRPQAEKRGLVALLLAIDFVLCLAPPIHWAVGRGDATISVGYFVVSGIVVTVSLFLMAAVQGRGGEDA